MDENRSSIAGDASLIAVFTFASRIAGFLRYLVFGTTVGAGAVGTAYVSANMLPSVLFEILAGGVLATSIIPVLAAAIQKEGTSGANQYVSALLNWALLLLLPVSALISAFSWEISSLILKGQESLIMLGSELLKVFAWQIPLYALSVIFAAFLQFHKRFFWPAVIPLVSSLVVIASYFFYGALAGDNDSPEKLSLAAKAFLGFGTTLGVSMLVIPLLFPAWRAGFRYRPTLVFPAATFRTTFRLGGAGIGMVAAQQFAMLSILVLAIRAGGASTLPVFQYANALYLLPFGVVVLPLITALFPRLASLYAVSDSLRLQSLSATGLRLIILASIIASSALWAASPALEQFFKIIDKEHVSGVGATVAALSLGLTGWSVTAYAVRLMSAFKESWKAFLIGSSGWFLSALLIIGLTLSSPMRTTAQAAASFGLCLAIGGTVAGTIGFVMVYNGCGDRTFTRGLQRTGIVVVPCAAISAICGWLISRNWIDAHSGLTQTTLVGAIAGVSAAAICALLIAILDADTMRELRLRLAK
ncbi:murein biosynthesis integral membrane protein MurJ [Dermabacteraceae bacterium P13101]